MLRTLLGRLVMDRCFSLRSARSLNRPQPSLAFLWFSPTERIRKGSVNRGTLKERGAAFYSGIG